MVHFLLTFGMTAATGSQVSDRSNILVEEGTDPRKLIIAFTGFQGALNVPVFDFLSATGLLGASRILLRDPSHLLYMRGCRPDAPGLAGLHRRLAREINRLAPEHVTCVGTSSGGYAAILYGHLLGADRVHAFAPIVYASGWLTLFNGDWKHFRTRVMARHLAYELMFPWLWKYRNLPQLLRAWNGTTEYTIHVCADNKDDMSRIEVFSGIPHVEISAHPCSTHQVAKYLVRSGQLIDVMSAGP
jgi:hypothetical protein